MSSTDNNNNNNNNNNNVSVPTTTAAVASIAVVDEAPPSSGPAAANRGGGRGGGRRHHHHSRPNGRPHGPPPHGPHHHGPHHHGHHHRGHAESGAEISSESPKTGGRFPPLLRGMRGLKVTHPAPDFTATAVMPDGSFQELSLSSSFKGKYVVLYFYPLDFTFVCPSEIIAFDNMVDDLAAKNVQLLGCSIDSHFTHLAWRNTPRSNGGIGAIKHPLISDITKQIARKYNVILPGEGVALRGLFLIDKEGIIRHMIVNDLPLGRSADEVMRVVDALQFVEANGEVCPANWKKGSKAMIPTAAGVAEYLKSSA